MTRQCDAHGCEKAADDLTARWRISRLALTKVFCSFKCLVRWALAQPINWSGKEPWRL